MISKHIKNHRIKIFFVLLFLFITFPCVAAEKELNSGIIELKPEEVFNPYKNPGMYVRCVDDSKSDQCHIIARPVRPGTYCITFHYDTTGKQSYPLYADGACEPTHDLFEKVTDIHAISDTINIKNRDVEFLYERMRVLFQQKRYAEALLVGEKLLRDYPDSDEAKKARGEMETIRVEQSLNLRPDIMPEFMQARSTNFTNNGYRVQVLGFPGFRHDKTVINVEYFPDGKRIMSSSQDGSIRVWEAKNGNELFCFKSKGPIKEAMLSGDGKKIILCGFNTITVWDVERRNIISKFNLPAERRKAGSYFIAVSKDGRRVMTGASVSDIIRLWDTTSGKLIKNLKVLFDEERPGLKYSVSSTALSLDGNFAVFGYHDRHNRDVFISLWGLDKGHEIKKLKLSEFNIVKSLAFSPDGERIIISSEFGLNLWDIREGIEVRTLDSNLSGVISASFSMDGKKVVVCHMSGVAIFDADTGYEVRSFQGGHSNIQCASASPDLDRVVLGDNDGAIKQKDFAGDREIVPWKYRSDDIRFIQFSPDGSMLLSGDHNSGMKLWDQSGRLLNSFRDSNLNKIICGAFSRDGKRLLSGSMWGVEEYPTLHQWDIRKPAKPTAFKGNNKSIWAVAFSAKGKVVSIGEPVTAFHGAWKERIFKKHWKEVKLRDVGRIVAFHPDHRRALVASTVVASKTGHLSCWDFKTGKCPAAWIDNDNSQYTALAFSPDGERILMVAKDLLIKMKDFQTGETLQIFKGHTQPVNALCFSPDGRQVISAGEGRTIYVWGAKTGKVLETIHNRTGTNPAIYGTSVRRLSVSPAGKRFAAANANGTICLYTKLSRKHDEKRGW